MAIVRDLARIAALVLAPGVAKAHAGGGESANPWSNWPLSPDILLLVVIAGALYAPQVGIITPAKIGVLPSIEMVVWVAAGGRGTLYGAVLGAFGVNWIQSWLTTSYPDLWLLFLGGLFMGAVLFFPDGIVGALGRQGSRAYRSVAKRRDRASLDTPRLSQATHVMTRPPGSDK